MPPPPRHEADIVIIGGGIAGQSLAASLDEDVRVVLLESENTLSYHTSSRSASQMQPSYGPPEIRALTAASLALMPGIEHTLGTSILSPRPLIWCGLRGSDQQADSVVASVPDAREGSVAEAVERLPALRADSLSSAAFDDNAKEVDVAALLSYYQTVLREKGVAVLSGSRLTAASPEPTATADGWLLRAGETEIRARVVVNAAGAWADSVAQLFGRAPRGLQPYRRTITVAPSMSRRVDPGWPMACDVGNTFYFRSIGSDILASPLEDLASDAEDAQPLAETVDLVKQRVNAITDLDLGPSRRSWTGLRTMTADGLPVVGREPGDGSFYWLAGQGGYGIQTSVALGRMVAADLLGTDAGLGPEARTAFERLVARHPSP